MRVIARKFFFVAAPFFFLPCHLACQAPPLANGPTETRVFLPDPDAFHDQALTYLRQRDFQPEYVNRAEGVILTQPCTGQQWFECWRQDAIGAYQLLESSLQTVRRSVIVRLEPLDEGDAPENYRLSVEVRKERYSVPERQVTTASGALALYSERVPTTEGLLVSKAESAHWVPLGRDVLLEERLLNRLALLAPPAPASLEEPQAEAEPAPADTP